MQVGQLQEPFCNNYLHVRTLQMKKVVLWTIAAAQVAENHGMRIDLVLMMSNIYINSNLNRLTKFTSSSRSTEFKDILPWNISQMIMKTIPISMRIVISYAMKWGILLWISWKVNGNWDNNMIRISQWRESHCKTNTSIRRKKEIQKSRTVRITVRDLSRKVNHLSMVIWNRKIMTELTRSISPTRIVKPVLMLVSRDKNISRWVDWENLIYVR